MFCRSPEPLFVCKKKSRNICRKAKKRGAIAIANDIQITFSKTLLLLDFNIVDLESRFIR